MPGIAVASEHFRFEEQMDWNAVLMRDMQHDPSGYLSRELVNPRIISGDDSDSVPIDLDVLRAEDFRENENDCFRLYRTFFCQKLSLLQAASAASF